MSDTILGGDFTVYYASDSNRKQIVWTGSATGTRGARVLYSALQDLFDDLNQMDDQIPMTAQTPTEFTLVNGWFMDLETVEHITGGAITTSGYAGNVIVRVDYTETIALIASDIGKPIVTGTNGYSGVLLDYVDQGAGGELWIRTDDPGTDLFSAAETFSITGGTGTGSIVVSTNATGENLWPNLFSLGSLLDAGAQTTLYVYQGGSKVTKYKDTTDFWTFGQIDILVPVRVAGTLIDDGFLTVFARRGQSLYSYFRVDASQGGRNPIPLQTAADLDDAAGPFKVGIDAIVGTPAVGDVLSVGGTVRAIITAYDTAPTPDEIEYLLVNDPITQFIDNDAVTAAGSGATFNIDATGSPIANVNGNSAAAAAITVTHAATNQDLNNGNGSRPYSIVINCNGQTLDVVYAHLKHITRRGETGTTKTDGIEGEQYIGSELQVQYNTQTGSFVEGEVVYAHNGSNVLVFEGTVVADHDDGATGDLILRNLKVQRGFAVTDATQIGDNIAQASYTDFAAVGSTRTINPIAAAPFGTFAGGTFFGAPGVWITNYAADQSFQLIDDDGVVQQPPNTVSVAITNTRAGDSLGAFRIVTDAIVKNEYSVVAAQAAGSTSLQVSTTISDEAPKSGSSWGNGGSVRIVDVSTGIEYKLRYTTFATDTFTLFNYTGLTADAGTNPTTIVDAAATFITQGVEPGDLVRNTTAGGIGYVESVDGETQLTLVGTGIAGQTTGDAYQIGTLPVLTAGGDTAYVPFIDRKEDTGTAGTPGSEFASIIYTTPIDIRVRVRQAGVILPFETDATIGANGVSVAAIRNPDTIYQ